MVWLPGFDGHVTRGELMSHAAELFQHDTRPIARKAIVNRQSRRFGGS